MNKNATKYLLIAFAALSIFYPLWERARHLNWGLDSTLIFNLFPLFGLAAFALLWLHVIGAAFEPWLRKHINFEGFVESTSSLILVLMLLHPLFLLIGTNFSVNNIFLTYGKPYILVGATGLLLLLTYDIGKALREREFFIRHWNKVLFVSTVGFILIFFHSLELGSDLQSGALRIVWIFYGVTAIISATYVYILKRFLG
jgi:hypothetical protein